MVCFLLSVRNPKLTWGIFSFFTQAFEHLIHREMICFTDNRGQNLSVEFRPVKLLISSAELHQGLRAYNSCPVS